MCRVQKEMQALIGAAGVISSPGTTFSPDVHGLSLSEPSTRPNSISEKKNDKKKAHTHVNSGITETTRSNNSSGSYSYAASSSNSSSHDQHDHHEALHPHVPFQPKNHHHTDLHGSDHDDSVYHGSDSDTPSVDHNHASDGDTLGSLPLSRLMEQTKLTDHELCSTDEEAEHLPHPNTATTISLSINSSNNSEFALQLPSGSSSPDRQGQPASAASSGPCSETNDPSDPTIIDSALDAELVMISQQLLETAKKTVEQLKVCICFVFCFCYTAGI